MDGARIGERILITLLNENLIILKLGLDSFQRRHLGPDDKEVVKMCKVVGVDGLEDLVNKSIPVAIHTNSPTRLGKPLTESETLARVNEIASLNKVYKSYLGLGYYSSITPPVILRNVMENPGWYTQVIQYKLHFSFIIVVHALPARNCSRTFRISC